MTPYTILDLGPDDMQDYCRLFSSAFGREPSVGTVCWKYFENPSGPVIWKGAVNQDGTLVAAGALVPELTSMQGITTVLYKCTDLMTHPDHQGKGLAKLINQNLRDALVSREVPLAYTLCSKAATPSFLKNGWQKVAPFQNRFKPAMQLRMGSMMEKGKTTQSVHSSAQLDASMDRFEFQQDLARISAVRSADILRWRTSNPEFSYGFIYSTAGTLTDGYLIYSIGSANTLHVVDVQSTTADRTVERNLMRAAEQKALARECRGTVFSLVAGSRIDSLLAEMMYLSNPFSSGPMVAHLDFNVLSLGPSPLNAMDRRAWDVSAFNYDDI
jgi:GNAT superfamily N-acetyltransferase